MSDLREKIGHAWEMWGGDHKFIEALDAIFEESTAASAPVEPPPELIDKWMKNELADYAMVLRHCSETYDHFTQGRISKPNTLPSEVFAVAEELYQRDFEDAVREEVEAHQASAPVCDHERTSCQYRLTLKGVTGALLDAGFVGYQPEDGREIVGACYELANTQAASAPVEVEKLRALLAERTRERDYIEGVWRNEKDMRIEAEAALRTTPPADDDDNDVDCPHFGTPEAKVGYGFELWDGRMMGVCEDCYRRIGVQFANTRCDQTAHASATPGGGE